MDLRKIKKLIELVEESGISELEVSDGDESIRIARPLAPAMPGATAVTAALLPVMPAPGRVTDKSDGFEFRAPMAGTFYQAPEPGGTAVVSVGQQVESGDVLCIIESMKMMNEISADRGGRCVACSVIDGEAIGSGQILFRFE